ncbi:amino acid/amide ABC transporter substrate-binding protein, HAAT family [Burkholderia sp. YR290]|nr:amino acid/amide ABC transporter substrate-binding protein, HAAT family [Burkholderia sp. YR290]
MFKLRFVSQVAIGLCLLGGLLSSAIAESLKIGVIAPLTGGGAAWDMAAAQGPKILAAEINAKGGLNVGGKKYQIEVIAYDDQYKAADAVAAYQRLVHRDGVKYVIIMSSTATMALRQSVEDDRILALTSSYTSKAVDSNSRYMFRMYSIASDYLPPFIAWMKGHLNGRRVIIVNPNDETGWDQTGLSVKVYKDNGFDVLASPMFERSQKDFAPLITDIVGKKPDLVDLSSTPPATAGLIIRQARELGYKGVFVKTGGAAPKDIVAAAGKDAAEGVINMLYADPSNSGYQRIASEYKKTVGQDPNEIIVAFYDGANVLLHAIQKAGDVDDTTKVAAAFAQALPMQSVQGDTLTLSGKTAAGGDKQIMTVNYIGMVKGGQPVVIGKVK